MLLTLLFAQVVASTSGQTFSHDQPSLLRQVVPRSTGRNGYEEYLMAADALRTREMAQVELFESYLLTVRAGEAWTDEDDKPLPVPRAPQGIIKESTHLDLMRVKARLARPAIELMRRGNRKPVFDPRERLDPTSLFPEFSSFKDLTKYANAAAYVEFAEGRPAAGTDILLESLRFANNISGGVLIAHLMGVAMSSITFGSFERHLPSLSLDDAQRVDRAAAELLAQPPTLVSSVRKEHQFAVGSLRRLLLDPAASVAEEYGTEGSPDPETETLIRLIKGLTPAQRDEIGNRVLSGLDAATRQYLAKFEGPERAWYVGESESEQGARLNTAGDLIGYLIEMHHPAPSSTSWLGRTRTQLRLLRLHGRIAAHRWRANALPKSLSEAASTGEIDDPFSGGQIQYEFKPDGTYRLFGKGDKSTGEIELAYRRPPSPMDRRELPVHPR